MVWIVVVWAICSFIPSASAYEAEALTASSTSTATPAILSTEGSISLLERHPHTTSLKLTLPDGSSGMFELDHSTTFWKNGQALALDQLKVGDRVKVRHLLKKGREIVKSIEVI